MTKSRLAGLSPILMATAGLLMMLASTPVRAQGTEEERRACTPDVMRLCREFIPSVSAITQCLVDKRAELNPDCKLVMTPKPQPVQHAAGAAKKPAAQKRAPAAKPTAPQPTAVATTVDAEPGAIIRRPLNIVPPPVAANPVNKPAKKKPARNAAAVPAASAPAAATSAVGASAAPAPAKPANPYAAQPAAPTPPTKPSTAKPQ